MFYIKKVFIFNQLSQFYEDKTFDHDHLKSQFFKQLIP